MTPGTNTTGLDVDFGHTGLYHLVPAQCPKVKMRVQTHVSPEIPGYLLAVVDELRTTGSYGRADTGLNPAGMTVEMLLHDLNGPADDILNTPAPTAMYVGNHPSGGLTQEHCLTVGDLNDKILSVNVRYHGICGNRLTDGGGVFTTLFMMAAPHRNLATMNLPDENKSAGCHAVGDDTPVRRHIFSGITDTVADI